MVSSLLKVLAHATAPILYGSLVSCCHELSPLYLSHVQSTLRTTSACLTSCRTASTLHVLLAELVPQPPLAMRADSSHMVRPGHVTHPAESSSHQHGGQAGNFCPCISACCIHRQDGSGALSLGSLSALMLCLGLQDEKHLARITPTLKSKYRLHPSGAGENPGSGVNMSLLAYAGPYKAIGQGIRSVLFQALQAPACHCKSTMSRRMYIGSP